MNNPLTVVSTASAIVALVVVIPAIAQPMALTQLFPALVEIELQSSQQASLEQLSRQTLPGVKRLLNPSQAQQFDAALKQGKSVRVALVSLNLSKSQQLGLSRKLQSMRSQLTQILTPEQQQQVTQNAIYLQQQTTTSK
ncbi:hypothetical protein [Chamaesiphon sp.]|uniref:hypothetical protein n=1 Tax=Chamaesiphon sp. TaxID=2814140 RepID=UPI00359402DD